jgi:Carboxypeptidase regulatory-like domain/TonB-dependent Receptor Plug Domain
MGNRVLLRSRRELERSRKTCWRLVGRLSVTALILIVIKFAVVPLLAQTTTGTISGTVADPAGALIPGAMVTATNEATGESRSTLTSETGTFSFPSLLPATYTIRVELAGFQTFQKTGNILTPNSRLDVGELKLAIGAVGETVNVEASVAQVQTASAENSALLTREQFSMIPTKGRDLTNMLRLLPGVQMTADQDAFGGATGFGATIGAVQGTRSAQQNLTVDGLVANDMGAPAGLSGQVNMDAVQEVKVLLSNYQAEYGRNPGANISMTTRSGTKEYHGSSYYYGRNDAFNANDFFRNRSTSPSLNSKPALYRFHTFGGTVGGPVPFKLLNPNREKLFFFYSFDKTLSYVPDAGGGLGVGAPNLTRYRQPTALERTGDFSQSATKPIDPLTGQRFLNDVIPANRINQIGKTLMGLYPLPNVTDNGSWNYETLRLLRIPNQQHVFRIDDKLTSKDTLYVRASKWDKDTYGPGGTVGYGSTPLWPYLVSHYQYGDDSIAGNYTRAWSPKIVSEFTIGARHSTEDETKDDFGALAATGSRHGLGINLGYIFPGPTDNIFDLIPNVTYTGGVTNPTTVGFGTRFGIPGHDFQFNVTHATTFLYKNHSIKAGLYWNIGHDVEGRSGLVNGSFDFGIDRTNPLDSGNHFANQLLGNFRTYTEVNTRETYQIYRYVLDWYVQDTWKTTRKLTLDYGLRFSDAPWFFQNNRRAAIFDPSRYNRGNAPRQYVPAIVSGSRVGFDPVTGQVVSPALISAFVSGTGNIANGMVSQTDPGVPLGFLNKLPILVMPRFGFAYDPFGNGKTAIRGGGGIFYQTEDDGFFTGLAQTTNPPFILSANVFNSNISQLTTGLGSIFPANVSGYDLKTGRPVIYNFSLGVQRDLGGGTVLDVKYVGSLGRHLGGRRNINTLPFGARFQPQNIDPTATVPGTPYVDNLLRPYPGFANITMLERNLSSNYNSLQATLNRRFTRALEFGIVYTYSKSLDYGSDERVGSTPALLPLSRSYGKSTFDQTHIFVANWQYDLPSLKSGRLAPVTRHWQLSGVASFASGTPLGINVVSATGADLLGGGGGADGQRVNLTCNPNLSHSDKTVNRMFDTSCIAFAPKGDIGNASKDVVRGPGRSNFDAALFRNFILGNEQRVLTFRWELYNVFNHTQFNSIDTTAIFNATTGQQVSPTFGQALGSWPARQMQFSMRLRF